MCYKGTNKFPAEYLKILNLIEALKEPVVVDFDGNQKLLESTMIL